MHTDTDAQLHTPMHTKVHTPMHTILDTDAYNSRYRCIQIPMHRKVHTQFKIPMHRKVHTQFKIPMHTNTSWHCDTFWLDNKHEKPAGANRRNISFCDIWDGFVRGE